MSSEGVTTGLNRPLGSWEDAKRLARGHPDGTFVAFVTSDDGHSPVVIPHYEHISQWLIDAGLPVPLTFVDARDPQNERGLHTCQVFSAPTICWIAYNDVTLNVNLRLVGTVTAKKLEVEVEKTIDRLYPDEDEQFD